MAGRQKFGRWTMCLWPGLPDLWDGRIRGLLPALLFAALAQLVIFVWQIWPDLLSPTGRLVVCFGVVLFWVAWVTPQALRVASDSRVDSMPVRTELLFQAAQREYLAGNFFQAEKLWEQLLEHDPEDVEAKLYLATLYRHANRHHEALGVLDELQSAEAARIWRWEIARERTLIQAFERHIPRRDAGDASASDAA